MREFTMELRRVNTRKVLKWKLLAGEVDSYFDQHEGEFKLFIVGDLYLIDEDLSRVIFECTHAVWNVGTAHRKVVMIPS